MLGFKPLPTEAVTAVDPQVIVFQFPELIWSSFVYLIINIYFYLNHVPLILNKMNFQILQLETVNNNMKVYYDAWDKYIKAWIVIKINDPSCVYYWRLQVNY